ncbi:MAG: phosphocholine cytidylyltransferase family protein, partial [Chlamydiota bacterium]
MSFSIWFAVWGTCFKIGIMKAIIFAAGCSSRLGELTTDLPKCCLQLTDSQTILQRALTSLSTSAIDHIVIVTGFAFQKIDEEVRAWEGKFDSIKTIYNPHYEQRNNIYTAYLVRSIIDTNTLILNSDLVFDPKILNLALEKMERSDESFLVVDDQKKLVDEDMKILVNEMGRVVRIHKSLDNSTASGEYIGMLRFSEDDLYIFKKNLENMIHREDFGKYYEDAIDEVVSDMQVSIVSTKGLPWTEVDSKVDY